MVKKKFHDSVFYKINPISGKHHMMFFVAIAIIICAAVCVSAVAGDCPHEDGWTPLSGPISSLSAGNYYLIDNATLSNILDINGEVQLCLNSYMLDLNKKRIEVEGSGNFSIYDCGDRVWQFEDTDNNGRWEVITDDRIGMYSLMGGIIVNGESGGGGGGINVASGCKVTMNGGNLVGSMGGTGGGAVETAGTFILNGGSISGNRVADGGGICVWDGHLIMNGGNISKNRATSEGGGIMMGGASSSSITINGGNITENLVTGKIKDSNGMGGGIGVKAGILTINNANISQNIAEGDGGGVYFNGNSMTVSGTTIIQGNTKGGNANNVYLATGKKVIVDDSIGLNNKSAIFVNNDANVATTNSLSSAVRFHSDSNSNKVVSLSGNTVSFVGASTPASGFPSTDHALEHPEYGDVTWYGWNDGSITPSNANYYVLTNDITLNDIWTVTAGTTYLCLNDNVLDLNGNYITVPYNANLVICDGDSGTSKNFIVDSSDHDLWVYDPLGIETVTGGVITNGIHNTGTSRGGAISVSGGLVLDGGNIVGNKADMSGGAVSVENGGSFTMNSGTLQGNTARWGGGAVEVDGSFNLNGGLISNNNVWVTSDNGKGGGVCIAEIGSATISGGEISNNNVVKGNLGGGIYFEGVALNIGGLVNIDENYASEKANNVHLVNSTSIHLRDLQSGSNIGVNTGANPETTKVLIAGNAKESDASSFKPDDDKGGKIKIYFEDSKIYMAGESILPDFQYEPHEGHEIPSDRWQSWKYSTTGPSAAGYYVLKNDISLSTSWTISTSGETWICLNGHVLDMNGNHKIIVNEGANLTICDCKYGGAEHTHYFDRPESVVSFWNDTTTYKYTDYMTHNYLWVLNDSNISSPYTVKGGVITNARNEACNGGTIEVAKNGTLTMLSGNIAGNNLNQTSDTNGAGGAINTKGTFIMYNGNITGNVAGAGGGGLQVAGNDADDKCGVFIMYGGNITENYSPRFGGGVTGWAAGTWEMHGGLISNNTADQDGGGVFVEISNFDMFNGLIRDNYAGYGGGICVLSRERSPLDKNKGYFTMHGGTVTNNTAEKYGGGLSPFAKENPSENTYGIVNFNCSDSNVPIIIDGNKKWNDSKGDYDRCNLYIVMNHISNIKVGDVLPAGSYIGVKPDPKLTTLIEIPVANTTRYENEIYFHADLEGDFEPFFDGDAQKIYLHSKSEVDGNFTRCEGHHLNHTELGEDIKWYDWNGTGNLMPRHSGYYVMTRDITLTDEMLDYHDPELGGNYDVWNITGEVIHICLNGHVLNLNNSRIRVSSKFIINDCNHDNGVHYFKTEDDGMWNLSDESDYHDIVYGGVITGNTKRVNTYANGPEIKEHGGAIRTVNGSVLFKNGTIVGNRAAVGGGIYVQGGNLTMVNGTIAGNAATDSGGGVEIKDLGRFEMRGGAVKNNTVLTTEEGRLQIGGGVCLGVNLHDDLVYFIMSGGVIKNNKVGTPENPGFGSGVFVDSRGEISMSGDATVDRSNEFYLSNISQPVQIFGDTFTGGILNINGTVYNETGHAMYTKIIQVTNESFDEGISASGILNQFDVGDVPKSLGAALKADSDETNKFILVDYEEPVDPDYYVKINQNADNATITLDGMDKTEDDIYPVTVGTDVRIITHLANPRYVFCNYTVKKETSEEIVETHNVSRNETYSIRNFTMEPDNIVVNATFGLRGDADYNGVVDIVDAACVGVHIIRDEDNHLITPDTNGYFCADVNSNNDIDVIDLYEINRYLVGIITYPGEEMRTNPFEHPEAEQNQNELQENG